MQVCSADLTVPVLHGAIIEGVATLICRLGSRLVALKEPQYDLDHEESSLRMMMFTMMMVLGWRVTTGCHPDMLPPLMSFRDCHVREAPV